MCFSDLPEKKPIYNRVIPLGVPLAAIAHAALLQVRPSLLAIYRTFHFGLEQAVQSFTRGWSAEPDSASVKRSVTRVFSLIKSSDLCRNLWLSCLCECVSLKTYYVRSTSHAHFKRLHLKVALDGAHINSAQCFL
jgi:hypothetical protein